MCETNQDEDNVFTDVKDGGDTVNSKYINEYCCNRLGDAQVSSDQFSDECGPLCEQSESDKSDNELDKSGTSLCKSGFKPLFSEVIIHSLSITHSY